MPDNADNGARYGDALLRRLYNYFRSMMTEDDVDLEINPENSSIAVQNYMAEWRSAGTLQDHHKIETLGYMLAGLENKTLDPEHPVLDTHIPYDGARVHIRLPAGNGRATLSLRKHSRSLADVETLEKTGMMTRRQKELLLDAVHSRKNIIFSGETGSGKTTILTAFLNTTDPAERLAIIEDTREIFIDERHWNRSETLTGPALSGFQAVKSAMRENPSRIIYGEVRDEAALALVESWNTGHRGGMGTIHADSAREIRQRLIRLCSHSNAGSAFDEKAVDTAIDIGVQLEIAGRKRHISEIYDFKQGKYLS